MIARKLILFFFFCLLFLDSSLARVQRFGRARTKKLLADAFALDVDDTSYIGTLRGIYQHLTSQSDAIEAEYKEAKRKRRRKGPLKREVRKAQRAVSQAERKYRRSSSTANRRELDDAKLNLADKIFALNKVETDPDNIADRWRELELLRARAATKLVLEMQEIESNPDSVATP